MGKPAHERETFLPAHGRIPDHVNIALNDLVNKAKEGLLVLSVSVGVQVLMAMIAEEVRGIAGPKGKHDPHRKAFRHGYERCTVILGGRKIAIKRPRVRTKDGVEVVLETFSLFKQADLLCESVLERMLHGLSTRDYVHGLETGGQEDSTMGISKSTVSRRFILATRRELEKLLNRPLGDLDILVVYIDGVVLGEHTITVALGVDGRGRKHILGLAEGATENATVCKGLLANLVERGLTADAGLLVVIDGSKALRKAVKGVFGERA